MQKITKTKSGKYHTQVFLGKDAEGKKIVKSITADTRRQCERQAAYLLEEFKDRGITENTITLRQACEQYLEKIKPVREAQTVAGYRIILENGFQDIMDIPIHNLTSEMLDDAILEESERPCGRKTGKTISLKTLKNEFGFIRSVLRWKKASCILGYQANYPKGETKFSRDLPRPGEIYKAVLDYGDAHLTLAVLLAIMCAYTMSEVRGLRVSSISDDGNFITINETVNTVNGQDIWKKRGKNANRIRRHRLPQVLKDALEPVIAGKDKDDVLFPMSRNALYKRWNTAQKRAGMSHISFHDLRHVAATAGHLSGMSQKTLEQHGGWSPNSQVLQAVYKENLVGERERESKILEEYFEEDFKKALEED